MELLVKYRETSADGNATISDLFVDGVRECWILEDRVREPITQPPLAPAPVSSWKVPGATAIPAGRYKVIFVWSQKRQCYVPQLLGVEGFASIEIHWGSTDKDTLGCLITGRTHPDHQDFVGESNAAWDALMPKLEAAWGVERTALTDKGKPFSYRRTGPGENVWITIDRGALLDPTSSAGGSSTG